MKYIYFLKELKTKKTIMCMGTKRFNDFIKSISNTNSAYKVMKVSEKDYFGKGNCVNEVAQFLKE